MWGVKRKTEVWARSPWYERNSELVLIVAFALFTTVLLARFALGGGTRAVSLLYVFPVSLLALTWGLRGGLVGSAVAVAGLVVPEVTGPSTLDGISWVTRISAIVLLGALVGAAQDRTRAYQLERLRQQVERDELLRRATQVTAAAEISDSLVQGMTSAKWLLELGNADAGAEILGETIARAEELVSELVDRQVGVPAPPAPAPSPQRTSAA